MLVFFCFPDLNNLNLMKNSARCATKVKMMKPETKEGR